MSPHTDIGGSRIDTSLAPDLVVVEPEPAVASLPDAAPPVFSVATSRRRLVYGIAGLVVAAMGYGAFSVVTLFAGSMAPEPGRVLERPAAGVTALAPATSVGSEACETIDVMAYIDEDRNGMQSAYDTPAAGVGLALLLADGTTSVAGVTDGAGRMSVSPAVRGVMALAVDDMRSAWLWPGPQLGDALGTPLIAVPACSVEVGLVRIEGGEPPRVAFEGLLADSRSPVTSTAAVTSAGLQVHGRVWRDVDANGVFTAADRGVPLAQVSLVDREGRELARVRTRASGLYSFAGLESHEWYEVRVETGAEVVLRRAMGRSIADDQTSIRFRTGSAGLPVWGLDFVVAQGSS